MKGSGETGTAQKPTELTAAVSVTPALFLLLLENMPSNQHLCVYVRARKGVTQSNSCWHFQIQYTHLMLEIWGLCGRLWFQSVTYCFHSYRWSNDNPPHSHLRKALFWTSRTDTTTLYLSIAPVWALLQHWPEVQLRIASHWLRERTAPPLTKTDCNLDIMHSAHCCGVEFFAKTIGRGETGTRRARHSVWLLTHKGATTDKEWWITPFHISVWV